jgi:protoporphyrinogen/coproporphyrinogen III oxidase
MGPRVAIVGGGISGLSCAYYLAKGGVAPLLIEARPRLGGVIQTERVEGCVIEAGPDSFLSVKPAAMDLIRELGLAGQVIGSNDHLRKTYVWKRGRLVALPDGLMMMVPTRILPMVTTSLLSWPTKIRMGLELFRSPQNGAADQSVAEFVASHYGAEAVDYLAEPLLSGIYGGSPQELSVRSVLPRFVELAQKYGSLTKGVLAERRRAPAQTGAAPLFRTLQGGLGQLVDAVTTAIAGKIEIMHRRAEAIERTASGYRIRLDGDWLEADRVVLACEAHRAAELVPDSRASELLAAVGYGSSMTVALGFQASDFPRPLEGFGFLVPKRERRRLVACTWVGTKFSHRVPEGKVLLRCFLGGTQDAGVLQESDEAITAAVVEELHRIVGFSARPAFVRIFRWPRAMAQYGVGHQERMSELQHRVDHLPGLLLAGNAYQGIGIPDCIRTGKQAAERLTGAQ